MCQLACIYKEVSCSRRRRAQAKIPSKVAEVMRGQEEGRGGAGGGEGEGGGCGGGGWFFFVQIFLPYLSHCDKYARHKSKTTCYRIKVDSQPKTVIL